MYQIFFAYFITSIKSGWTVGSQPVNTTYSAPLSYSLSSISSSSFNFLGAYLNLLSHCTQKVQ
ncbi:hypothetical protein HOG27_01135 [bacterium]|nr:hypothetical protein [bacterium]